MHRSRAPATHVLALNREWDQTQPFLPGYKDSRITVNLVRNHLSPYFLTNTIKNVDLWDMDGIINLSSNMDLHICSQNVHFMFVACSPVFGYIISKES